MNVHPLYLTIQAFQLFTRLVLQPGSSIVSSLLEQLRISLRIHHKAASRYGLPTYLPLAMGLQPRRFMLSIF